VSGLSDEEKLTNLETIAHIRFVQRLLNKFAVDLIRRGEVHDQSKLDRPEVSAFAEHTKNLATTTYGSEMYEGFRKALGPALDHHYANNTHHPEHYPRGIDGMSLLDVVEMFCDWYAAGKRHNDGNIRNSLRNNKPRFNVSDQLEHVFENTISFLESEKL
jgi:hypothetical protein